MEAWAVPHASAVASIANPLTAEARVDDAGHQKTVSGSDSRLTVEADGGGGAIDDK